MDQITQVTHIDNVKLTEDKKAVVFIDQTQLPNRTVYLTADTEEDCFDAILKLKVRGAPCIGIFAGYAMYVLCQKYQDKPYAEFAAEYKRQSAYLNSSRPTAVNLSWALKRMEKIVEESSEVPVGEIVEKLGRECVAIHEEDIAMCRKISEYGLSLIMEGDVILTHCNAGPLATSRYGTALGPMFLGKEKGMNFRVFADETRPLLQGARLTSY